MARPAPKRRSFAIVMPSMALAFVASFGAMRMMDRENAVPTALADMPASIAALSPVEQVDTRFSLCSDGRGDPCVVDGDTLRYAGRRIRLLGIDTPELHPARCAAEERLGQAAKLRMQELVNGGPFQLVAEGRDRDRFGRDLRKALRGNDDLGLLLVREGLARPYGQGRQSWC